MPTAPVSERAKDCDFLFRLPIVGNTLTTHRCHLKPEHTGDHVCTCGRKIFYRQA